MERRGNSAGGTRRIGAAAITLRVNSYRNRQVGRSFRASMGQASG